MERRFQFLKRFVSQALSEFVEPSIQSQHAYFWKGELSPSSRNELFEIVPMCALGALGQFRQLVFGVKPDEFIHRHFLVRGWLVNSGRKASAIYFPASIIL